MSKNHDPRIIRGIIYLAAYLASIIGAAALVVYVGPVSVGFGLIAPAAAYLVGVTLVLRDLTQDQLGPRVTYGAIIAGTILSALMSPEVALGSAAGFLIAETFDLLVYTPLRARGHLIVAVLASNAVSILLDSFVFLQIAFGDLTFLWGQVWAKVLGTIAAIVLLPWVYRNRMDKRPAYLVARDNHNDNEPGSDSDGSRSHRAQEVTA